eukprot:gnl/Trimastix_PCT/571.p1 GENE.gnl/Trimastix_PCT/571~~gnl/Trimastix_PCT/571.p1  ORF type:complete len:361 (+),score=83.49 gnl/Trimastix_PCT/571:36-1085(+)
MERQDMKSIQYLASSIRKDPTGMYITETNANALFRLMDRLEDVEGNADLHAVATMLFLIGRQQDEAIEELSSAISLAPTVSSYYALRATVRDTKSRSSGTRDRAARLSCLRECIEDLEHAIEHASAVDPAPPPLAQAVPCAPEESEETESATTTTTTTEPSDAAATPTTATDSEEASASSSPVSLGDDVELSPADLEQLRYRHHYALGVFHKDTHDALRGTSSQQEESASHWQRSVASLREFIAHTPEDHPNIALAHLSLCELYCERVLAEHSASGAPAVGPLGAPSESALLSADAPCTDQAHHHHRHGFMCFRRHEAVTQKDASYASPTQETKRAIKTASIALKRIMT